MTRKKRNCHDKKLEHVWNGNIYTYYQDIFIYVAEKMRHNWAFIADYKDDIVGQTIYETLSILERERLKKSNKGVC